MEDEITIDPEHGGNSNEYLNSQVYNVNRQQKDFQCEEYYRQFGYKHSLKIHLKMVHGNHIDFRS